MFETSDLILKLTDFCVLGDPCLASFGGLDPSFHLRSIGHDRGSGVRVLVMRSRPGDHDCRE